MVGYESEPDSDTSGMELFVGEGDFDPVPTLHKRHCYEVKRPLLGGPDAGRPPHLREEHGDAVRGVERGRGLLHRVLKAALGQGPRGEQETSFGLSAPSFASMGHKYWKM